MVSFQKQIMRVKDRFLKKQNNIFLFAIFFCLAVFSNNSNSNEIAFKIENYIKKLDFFSSKFIQSNGMSLEEGDIFINNKKIRLDYFKPHRTLIISKKKGVYINHELKEESFFSNESNIVHLFYDIFLDNNFYLSMKQKEVNGGVIFEKDLDIDSVKSNIKILFENNPLLLRKIIISNESEKITVSFSGHKYNNTFDDNLFSFVPMYLD